MFVGTLNIYRGKNGENPGIPGKKLFENVFRPYFANLRL